MSRRPAKAQASSSRAAFGAFGSSSNAFGTGSSFTFGASSSQLSYVTEPPDLSGISDPNVVVYFRNLSKKDSTTKAKALEDIQTYVSSLKEPVEEAVLEAWIKLFPRTSIDNSRRVRQLAYTLHGQISVSAGKKVAKHMPKAVGAWLCGLYDTDRAAAKAAQDSLRQVFTTPEKLQNLRKAYQQPILEYCRDAIQKETALTLSDERTVSPDDAEAKYCRVVAACIAVIGSLLTDLRTEDIAKYQSDYNEVLGDATLWAFASYSDPSVRRSTHRLLKTCVSRQTAAMEEYLDTISKAYLGNALNSEQMGSSYDYADALSQLTTQVSSVWTDHYKSKTSVQKRLRQFLKRGSQSGPREFWGCVGNILKNLPQDIIPHNAADAAELLGALHGGIVRKEEPRSNRAVAYDTYLDTAALLCGSLGDDDKGKLLTELVLPIISQFIRPTDDGSNWALPSNSSRLVFKATAIAGMPSILETQWQRYAEKLAEDIKTSAPEQSKEYGKSQDALIAQGARFATLQESIMGRGASDPLWGTCSRASAFVVGEALSVLKTRNGKPYGAAGVIAEIVKRNRDLVLPDSGVSNELSRFVQEDLPLLLLSPSSSQLSDVLFTFHDSLFFKDAWKASLRAILHARDSDQKNKALESLIASPKIPDSFDLATSDEELQNYIRSRIAAVLEGNSDWESLGHIFRYYSKTMSDPTTDDILSQMTESLSISDQSSRALHGFHHVIKQAPSFLKSFLSTPKGSDLLTQLLSTSESPDDEIAQQGSMVYSSVQALLTSESGSKQSLYDLIHNGLLNVSEKSISVETLVDLANGLVSASETGMDIEKVLPTADEWDEALRPFLTTAPKHSLAFVSSTGGAVYLVRPDGPSKKISYDGEGYSAAFRIGQFITKLAQGTKLSQMLSPETAQTMLRNLMLTSVLASDNITLAGANHLWIEYNPESEADAVQFSSQVPKVVSDQLNEIAAEWLDEGGPSPLVSWAIEVLTSCPSEPTPEGYYLSSAGSALIARMIELQGWKAADTPELEKGLKSIRKHPNMLVPIGFLIAFKEPLAASRTCERMCNELVADLTYSNTEQKREKTLQQLVLLNVILHNQDEIGRSIAKPRLVSFVKHVVPWLQDKDLLHSIRAETCRALASLLPLMSDIYDSLWGDILEALSASWLPADSLGNNEDLADRAIPYVHASLKLYEALRRLSQGEEPNDDLLDAWKDSEQSVARGLVNLLKHSHHFPDEYHQPLTAVNDVLARQISKVPLKHLESAEELFPLLYVQSQPVQQAAFDIIHRQIESTQEQISIDAVLDKQTARLPEELLSLILESPTMATLAEADFERSMPLSLRGYLLSWLLVFDHLKYASFKVKSDYIEHLKEGDYLSGLLDFMFDFLGHGQGKPIDVKFDVTNYAPDQWPPRQDTQWLLTHIYFLCLQHIPSLTRSWWVNCKSRAIAVSLENWTEKFISPPVISAALQTVTDWSKEQEGSDPDSPFTVKVSSRAREITATYTVDEQTMSMRITLPPSFPLSNVLVEGLDRLAVDEKKWQSWLRISQGAITFSNGDLLDGLTTFKRNVEGALKGQTECAICYSIVGPDRRVPEKRCNTCKNLFHGSCLFKWFRTSGASSCPLCRNAFHYG